MGGARATAELSAGSVAASSADVSKLVDKYRVSKCKEEMAKEKRSSECTCI